MTTSKRPPLKLVKGKKHTIDTTTLAAPVGRPSKATHSTLDKIVEALKLGATHKLAAQYAGIHEATFYEYVKDYPEFSEAIALAEAEGALQHLGTITALTRSGDPAVMLKASTWLLERRFPESYGRTVLTTQQSGEQVIRVIVDNAWRGEPQIIDSSFEDGIETVSDTNSDTASDHVAETNNMISISREGD